MISILFVTKALNYIFCIRVLSFTLNRQSRLSRGPNDPLVPIGLFSGPAWIIAIAALARVMAVKGL